MNAVAAQLPSSAPGASIMTRFATNDVDELTQAFSPWTNDAVQLRPGAFQGDITRVLLGPVWVHRAHVNQVFLQHCVLPPECITICRPGRGSAPVVYRGHELDEHEVFLNGPSTESEVVNRGRQIPTAISIRLDFLRSQAHWLSSDALLKINGARIHSPGSDWVGSYHDALEWVLDAATEYATEMADPQIQSSLADALLHRVDTLRAAEAAPSQSRETRTARRQAVDRAREYIRANLAEPIRLSALCKHARTQARSLEYGFREVLGLSPIAYVRTMRLHRVRRLLLSTAVRSRSISEIAMDCGFWHLSQFAVDYKSLFSESPSVTYRRTRAQLPSGVRRRTASIDAVAAHGTGKPKSAYARTSALGLR